MRPFRKLCAPVETVVNATGDTTTQPRYDLCLGNWAQILATTAVGNVPHTQSGPPASAVVAAVALVPQQTGVFFVSARLSWTCGTTGILVTHALFSKQGSGQGIIAGGTAAAKLGQFAGARNTTTGFAFTPSGQILNVDAVGGGGLTFEGAAPTAAGVSQHADVVSTLTGLLTGSVAGANSTQNFEFSGYLDAAGPGTVKTPFTVGQPVVFALAATCGAAATLTYGSVYLFAQETVTP